MGFVHHNALWAKVRLALPVVFLTTQAGAQDLTITPVVKDLTEPWAVDFTPDGAIMITERDGALIRVAPDGTRSEIDGVPQVVSQGQGGLLDIMVPRDFAQTREIFLSFSIAQQGGSGTALASARLSDDNRTLEDVRVIFQQARGFSAAKHFGSRIVEAADGTLFLTIGERGARQEAQNLRNHNGTVVRLRRSGAIPPDNPFVGRPDAEPEIWSYGHRNPQGAALDLDGNLWVAEHGAKGGDEVNRIIAGANYGWPVISYGVHYSGARIGEGTSKPGMEQPAHYWDPSIAPSGMMVYSGKLWPDWAGDIFVGSLKFSYIARLDGGNLDEDRIETEETLRVRDIMEGPDGAIWFLSVGNGTLYKITPSTQAG